MEKIPKVKQIKGGCKMDIISERNKAFAEGYREGYEHGRLKAVGNTDDIIYLEELKALRNITKGDFGDALEKVIRYFED